jgi:hypothetical protein
VRFPWIICLLHQEDHSSSCQRASAELQEGRILDGDPNIVFYSANTTISTTSTHARSESPPY